MPAAPDDSGPGGDAADPLRDEELIQLAEAGFAGLGAIVVAASGGPDSTALMLTAALWRAARGSGAPPVVAATVDHGWRPEAAAEAERVALTAAQMNIPHRILKWVGPKPPTGRQAAARAARYGLLRELAERLGLPWPVGLAVGHTRDDQAETLLMRLARGSGVDGLSAMAARRELSSGRSGMLLVRPLLGISKARLVATLEARGIAWSEDPSNASADFERVRVRATLGVLEAHGIGREALAASARRLGRARAALDAVTDAWSRSAVDLNGGAFGSIQAAVFDAAPAELRLRLLQRLVTWFGGSPEPARMAQLERLLDGLAAGRPFAATLAGCQLRRTADAVVAMREPGRCGLPVLELRAGDVANWDGRFEVWVSPELKEGVTVRALPAAAWRRLAQEREAVGRPRTWLPRKAALTLPSFWRAGKLLGVGHAELEVQGAGRPRPVGSRFVAGPRP